MPPRVQISDAVSTFQPFQYFNTLFVQVIHLLLDALLIVFPLPKKTFKKAQSCTSGKFPFVNRYSSPMVK
jgi:hypothetical protein